MADEFRHDAAGFAGKNFAATPCLDALAEGAANFTSAYSPSPLCVPARQCLATGLYPGHAGCLHFGDDLEPGAATFARHFSEHGYYTVCCGKLHHRGPDQMQGWLHRIGAEQAVRWPAAYKDRVQVGRKKWRGAKEILEAGCGVSPLGLADDLATTGACDFLRMHFGGHNDLPPDIPVFLMLSLQQPHFPLLAPKELLENYLTKVSVFEDAGPLGHLVLDEGRLGLPDDIADSDLRRATAAYAAMVEQTDTRFAQVLSTLREVGQDPDEWLIVFCADHGDMLGEHGLWGKRKFYEGSVRVPLFVRGPGVATDTITRNVNLVDIFPTLCQLAGLPVPMGLDGRDLLDSRKEDMTFSQLGADQWMVKRGPWKLMIFPEGGDVLFQLDDDPDETINRIADPECQSLIEELKTARIAMLDSGTCPKS